MYTVILAKKYNYRNPLFALCEKCYWTATILKEVETYQCPVCHSDEVALIPIGNDESYEYSLESKQGLQIKFSPLSR
jgi:Zn finger protein HypA/HybF involved in hydrogenase expression